MMVVDADEAVRLERAEQRGLTRADAERRMASQPNRAQWLAAADLVIPNHGGLHQLAETVRGVVEILLTPSKQPGRVLS
jgi:dephospho-CoA kinase